MEGINRKIHTISKTTNVKVRNTRVQITWSKSESRPGQLKKIWTIIIGNEHCSQRPLDVIGGDNDEEDEEYHHLGAIGAEGDATEKTLSGMGGQ